MGRSKTVQRVLVPIAAAVMIALLNAGAVAQSAPPVAPATSTSGNAPASGAVPPAKEESLDDLLGLKKPADGDTKVEAKDAAKAELDRKLKNDEMDDEFEQAVKLMGETAQRLDTGKDAGLDTQRMQEETLAKLDKLIDMAKSQKSKSKSKKKQSQQQQSDSKDQQQQQSQSSQQNQQGQEAQQQPGGNAQGGNVGAQSGKLNAPPGAGAAWGQLPERLRQALMQGSGDFTSAKWESLTREYYKRLAEQPGGTK